MTIMLYIKNNARKLFEFIGNPDNDLGANLDRQNPGLKAIFVTLKLNYNLHQYTSQFQATKSFNMNQLKAYRTGV